MSDQFQGKGSCLCSAVRISARQVQPNVGACHCTMCRKWGGGPLFAVDCGTEVVIDGSEHITIFDSSKWAERGFCAKCGSHLFYRLKDSRQYIMPAGLFDDDLPFVLDHQIFIDEKPDYYAFANETQDMTGPEVFAKFAPPSE